MRQRPALPGLSRKKYKKVILFFKNADQIVVLDCLRLDENSRGYILLMNCYLLHLFMLI